MKRTIFLLTIVRRTKWRGSHPPVVTDTTTVVTGLPLLAMYIMILHILCPDRRRLRLHHLGAVSRVSPSPGSSGPHPSRMYLLLVSSCCDVANLVFRRCG